ncbi:MAG: hypothetical protein ACR2GQ_00655 [Gemmatimonadota bacterium]
MWNEPIDRLETALVELLWAQWAEVTAAASSRRRGRSLIDPEALVLTSLALRNRERRLWDMLGWCASETPRLLSVQRARNLVDAYPPPVRTALGGFAQLAVEEGADHRWRTLQTTDPETPPRASKLGSEPVRLIEDSTMWLRLRLGLGVGVKADLLAFLIACGGAAFSVRDMAGATGYTTNAIRRAADELGEARVVRVIKGYPVEYHVDGRAWLDLLEVTDAPPWRYWHQVFSFATRVFALRHALLQREASRYVASSELRQLSGKHAQLFAWNRITAPAIDVHPGEEFLDEFGEAIGNLAGWVEAHS